MSIKKIVVFVLAIVIVFVLSGCESMKIDAEATRNAESQIAIIKLPNGDIIYGNIENYVRISSNWISVIIDGVQYMTNEMNVAFVYE